MRHYVYRNHHHGDVDAVAWLRASERTLLDRYDRDRVASLRGAHYFRKAA